NLVVVKHNTEIVYSTASIASAGKNNPVLDETLMGQVLLTLSAGREVYRA
ncbi:MAG: dihydroorotase-like cyclic amidohydrolase, partial [Oleispira sp.]